MVDACKKGGLNEYAGIDEAAVVLKDGSATKFKNPKLFGSNAANAWCLFGATTAMRVDQLPGDLQGNGRRGTTGAGSGSRGASGMEAQPTPQQMQQIVSYLSSKGFSQEDLQNPAKQGEIQAALLQMQGSGGIPGARAEDDDVPEVSADFQAVADDAD